MRHYHRGWHRGYWNWRSFGWGVAAGFFTSRVLSYASGYHVYANPYYVPPVIVRGEPVVVDYSRPIVVTGGDEEEDVSSAGLLAFDNARESFSDGDYASALEQTEQAISEIPNDPDLHYFRAQTLFAQGQYEQAAAATHATMATNPGWSWETVSGLYPDAEVYTQHLRALEAYVEQNPDSAPAQFLLAYQYLMLGFADDAATVLAQVVELQPQDELSAELLKALSPREETATEAEPSGVQAEQLHRGAPSGRAEAVGTWTSERDDGTSFELVLQGDGAFLWSFTRAGRTQAFAGQWNLEDDVLTLERDDGGSMIARIHRDRQDRFNFHLIDGDADDPGLNFSKAGEGP